MSTTPVIECKPSKWFKIRAILILLMLGFFCAWFLKDGYSGYRAKNLEYVSQQLFSDKKENQDDYIVNVQDVFNEGDYTEESWREFAGKQVLSTPAEERGLMPRDYDFSSKWPDEVVNGYEALKEEEAYSLWKEYSGRMEWALDGPEKLYDEGKIKEQFITAGVCAVLFLIAAFICIRTMGRSMIVTKDSYIAPGGKEFAFSAMRKIDMRKWDNKGIAIIYADVDGSTKKAKVDGMVYGQFKPENGAPAEKLFGYILENFKGELIEYVADDEDEEGEQGSEAVTDAASE